MARSALPDGWDWCRPPPRQIAQGVACWCETPPSPGYSRSCASRRSRQNTSSDPQALDEIRQFRWRWQPVPECAIERAHAPGAAAAAHIDSDPRGSDDFDPVAIGLEHLIGGRAIRLASHTTRGDTLSGSNTSKTPGGGGLRLVSIRVRADGETALERTPYFAPSIATTRDNPTTPSLADA